MNKLFLSKIILLSITLTFISCLKKELPVPKHDSGNVQTAVIPLTSNYKYQIFFSLKNQNIVQQQLKTIWDIAFDCKGNKIILNSSKFMFAFKTSYTNIKQNIDTTGFTLNKKFDSPTGNLDSTAIGNWWEHNNVYVIHRGYNENGISLGFQKFKVISYNNHQFTFSFANLNDTTINTFTLQTDTNYRFIGFNFTTKQIVYCEPPKTQWDLLFTQYTEQLSEPYLVTGCLINNHTINATITTSEKFDDINYYSALHYNLSNHANIIGYNWKEYNFNSASYVVYPDKVYLIKDNQNYFYKLRFIDFYSTTGEKGFPKFEYQRL